MTADAQTIRADLVALSNRLGDPALDLAILGEGNTSADLGDGTFLVKASGCELATLGPEHLVQVSAEACATMLDGPDLTDDQIKAGLTDAVVDGSGLRPSVETVLHATLLTLPGVTHIGHTHPTSVNGLACSDAADRLADRLFPDHIVVCGPDAVLVDYVDPGLPLARAVRDGCTAYRDRHGEVPKQVFLRSHGFIALGASAAEVVQIHRMTTKAARILSGALAAGTPVALTPQQIARIHGRDDEHHRRAMLRGD